MIAYRSTDGYEGPVFVPALTRPTREDIVRDLRAIACGTDDETLRSDAAELAERYEVSR